VPSKASAPLTEGWGKRKRQERPQSGGGGTKLNAGRQVGVCRKEGGGGGRNGVFSGWEKKGLVSRVAMMGDTVNPEQY